MAAMHDSQPWTTLITPQQFAELLTTPPRSLSDIDAEILLINESFILHYKEEQKDVYKCLSAQALQQAFSHQPSDSGWIPENLVRHGKTAMGDWSVLFIPPQIYSIQLEHKTTVRTLKIPLPSFIFFGINTQYWLGSIKETSFNSNSQVYYPPLPNTDHTLKICWGNNQPQKANLHQIQKAWTLFMSSVFSPHYVDDKSEQYPKNVIKRLQAFHRKKHYPLEDLIPTNKTVDQLVHLIFN